MLLVKSPPPWKRTLHRKRKLHTYHDLLSTLRFSVDHTAHLFLIQRNHSHKSHVKGGYHTMINTDKSVPDDRFSDGLFEQYQQSVPSSVGRAVVQARRRLGLSQQEVADGTQLSRQQLSRMETGKIQRFNPELMKELFEYLELPSPETFQEDDLSPKIKRAISLLRSQGGASHRGWSHLC